MIDEEELDDLWGSDTRSEPEPIPEAAIPFSSIPKWAPPRLADWLGAMEGKIPSKLWNRYIRLASDDRMRTVWAWHATATATATATETETETAETRSILRSPITFLITISSGTKLPGFPGNMTRAKRAEYFEKVRKHTEALIGLLEGTVFSSNSATYKGMRYDEIDNDNLMSEVASDLRPWGDDDSGHIVAYHVDSDGVSRMPVFYPENTLYDLLQEVVDWTTWDDHWDYGWGASSSAPIAQTNASNSPVIFLTCTIYDDLERHGLQVPFSHLATIANVSLQLPPETQLDEDSARKQVRRYQERRATAKKAKRDDTPY